MTKSQEMLLALENSDLDLAEKCYQEALLSDDQETLLDLATYLEQIGFYPHAKTIYLNYHQEVPELNLNLAQIASDDGNIEEAFLYLENISKDSPYYVNSLLVMADLYDSEGLTDVAREKLLAALALEDDPLIRFGLAEIDLSLGYIKEAVDYYASLDNRAILEATGVSTYERIGKAYASIGQFEAATSFLEKAVEIAYDEQTVFELASILFEQEAYQKANLYFKQLTTISPDFEGYHYLYAQSLKAEHQLEAAYRTALEGLSKNTFDGNLLLLASQLAYENQETEKAENYLLQAREVIEDEEEVILPLSKIYLEQERFEDLVALDHSDITNVLTKWQIAKGYEELGNEEETLSIYQSIAKDLADNPDFLSDYAYLLRSFGYRDEASKHAKAYLSLVPDDVSMLDFLESLGE